MIVAQAGGPFFRWDWVFRNLGNIWDRVVEHVVLRMNEDGAELRLLFWEPGSMQPIGLFLPNFYVELSDEDVQRKQRSVDCYVSQFPREAGDGFAARRASGYGGLAGLKYAEAFRRGPAPRGESWGAEPGFFASIRAASEPPAVWPLGE